MASVAIFLLITFLFGTIAAQCPQGYTEIRGECFFFDDDVTESWSAGQLLCELKGGRLAFIDDCRVLSDVVLHIQENGLTSSPGFWLGGTDLRVEGTFEWLNRDSVPMGTPFWGTSMGFWEPSGGTEQNCLAMNRADAYFFGDIDCDIPLGVLCQTTGETTANTSTMSPTTLTSTPWWTTRTSTPWWTTTFQWVTTTTGWFTSTTTSMRPTTTTTPTTTTEPARCPVGFEYVSSYCLRFLDDVSESDTWSSAELRCQLVDGHLATFEGDGCQQLGEVVKYIDQMGYSPPLGFWLGATDLQVEGRFEWINGGVVSERMPLWGTEDGSREPSGGKTENCLAIIKTDRYYFHDQPCSVIMGAICEVPPITAETREQEPSDRPNKL